jgi:hypothetical protein
MTSAIVPHGNSKYTPELGDEIIELLMQDYTPDKIAPLFKIAASTIYGWMYRNDDFANKYARAKPAQANAIDAKIANTIEKTLEGNLAPDIARVALSGLQWRASKKDPKVYGDRQILAGDAENPLQLLASRLDQAIAKQDKYELQETEFIDVTPMTAPTPDDGSDLV